MLPRQVLYDGTCEPPPAPIPLRAGPLNLLYDNGDLRYIRLGEQMLLLRVYTAIRDHNWGTVLPVMSNLQIDIASSSFRITYEVENKQSDIDFAWRGEIAGETDGTIRFAMDGEARSTFRRNRIGFCVLHPMSCAGQPVRIGHVDGRLTETVFPTAIAPQYIIDGMVKPMSPFAEMGELAHEVLPGLWAHLGFEGDIFETEDQRNWTDASFKTYCTPLRLPFPVEIEAGTKVRQAVTLTLRGTAPESRLQSGEQKAEIIVSAGSSGPLPPIGLGVASHDRPLSDKELARLRALHLAHLRVGLRLSEPDLEARLRQAAAAASALGVQLEAALFLSDGAGAELAGFARLLSAINPPVRRWLIFHQRLKSTSAEWLLLARKYLAAHDPVIPIGSGTNAFFTELNRERPPLSDLDLVCYSLNPQVHAFDNLSLVETLPAQAVTVASARAFCGDKPLAVTPVTLKMRFNPNATGPEPGPEPGQLPSQVDVRQMSLFGAGWTLGSLKHLAASDVQSLTYFETTGWRGVMETETGSPLPDQFPSLPGSVFPMYHVFADVGEFAGGEVAPARTSNSLLIETLALRRGERKRLLIANLSNDAQRVGISGLPEHVTIRVMDESNAEWAMLDPEGFRSQPPQPLDTHAGALELTLLPYAIARIDG